MFDAEPDALLVDEWVPNIKLPPPPVAPLEEDEVETEGKALKAYLPPQGDLDEREGPARIYVGQGMRFTGSPQAEDEDDARGADEHETPEGLSSDRLSEEDAVDEATDEGNDLDLEDADDHFSLDGDPDHEDDGPAPPSISMQIPSLSFPEGGRSMPPPVASVEPPPIHLPRSSSLRPRPMADSSPAVPEMRAVPAPIRPAATPIARPTPAAPPPPDVFPPPVERPRLESAGIIVVGALLIVLLFLIVWHVALAPGR